MAQAYSYIRMSTETQLRGDSLRRQRDMSAAYAATHGLVLVEDASFQDLGVSAFKGDNVRDGALGKFLQAVRAGHVSRGSFLLVESLDRLSRQRPQAAVRLFLDIIEAGVNIVTLADGHVYREGNADLSDMIYSLVVMSRAHDESEMKSQRVAAAWAEKRNKTSSKKLTKQAPQWLSLSEDRTSFKIDEKRAAIVRRIFSEASHGDGSFLITRRLNKEKIAPFGRSKQWSTSSVTKILKSRAVLGEFQPHRLLEGRRIESGPPIADYFPPLISEEQFLQVQSGRRERGLGGGGRKGERLSNLFSHLAKCAYCGSPMRYLNKGGGSKGGAYLVCSRALQGGDCVRVGWRYRDFETSFLMFTRELNLRDLVAAAEDQSVASSRRQIELQLNEKLRILSARRDKAFDLIDVESTEYVRGRLNEIEGEIGVVLEQISTLRAQTELRPPDQSVEELERVLTRIQSEDGPDVPRLRALAASKLRGVIRRLSLAAAGSEPMRQRAFEQLRELFEADRHEELAKLVFGPRTRGSIQNPGFSVAFANGELQDVVVDKEDPTKLVVRIDGTLGRLAMTDEKGELLRAFAVERKVPNA